MASVTLSRLNLVKYYEEKFDKSIYYSLDLLSLVISVSNQTRDLYKTKNTQINLSQLFATARWRLDSQQQYKEVRVPLTQKKRLNICTSTLGR